MIPEFYENCEIFMTGGSGMVGKAIIEKLLRSCNVKRIYVLLRPKKNLNVEERLQKLRNAEIFNVLRSTKPHELDKIIAIPGDAALPNLGITPDYAKIMENTSVIFHCAATVRFDEPLNMALTLNVGGTVEALKFAESLKNLKIFMHVSTFFSNPYLEYVEAKIYPPPMDWRTCMRMINDNKNQDSIDSLTKKMITGFANTYTFTKNLSENVVNEFRHRVPVAIFRPSIVIFAISEPEPGFPPGLIGAMGLFALVCAGILKTVYIDTNTHLDLAPQDCCIKLALYYAMKAAELHKKGKMDEAPVYLFSTHNQNPHTFKHLAECPDKYNLWENAATVKSFMLPNCVYTSCRFYYMFLVFTKQIFPALLVDGLLKLFGRKPALMSIIRRSYNTLEVMKPFMFNNFKSSGITDLDEFLNCTKENDRDFKVDPDIYIGNTEEGLVMVVLKMVYGVRKVLLKEDTKSLSKARKIMRIKILIYNMIRVAIAYYVFMWLYRVFTDYINENLN